MDAAVQFDDIAAAGLLVQAIDVLGHDHAQIARLLQLRQRPMRGIGRSLRQARPAQHAARPVTLAGSGVAAEFIALDGQASPAHAGVVTVVGNAGGGADARPGQHHHAAMPAQQVCQR